MTLIHPSLTALAVPVAELRTLPGNPRRGDVDAVARSYERFGQRKPIVARRDEDGGATVIAGNHQLEAARRLGWTEIAVLWVEDDALTAKAFALADNRTADLGTYDEADLAALLSEVAADPELLAAASYSEADLAALLGEREHEEGKIPPVPAVPYSTPGDVWVVAGHRVACGDSTDPAVLDAALAGELPGCVLTDPPYGIALDTDYTKMPSGKDVQRRTYRKVEGDDRPFDAGFHRAYFAHVREQFWFGANYYRRTLSEHDLDGSWLVWDKRPPSQDAYAGSVFELIWSAQRHKQDLLRYNWSGFQAKNPGVERVHPTEKPIALLREVLERWAPAGCVVVDPFAGSGTSLLAAHATGRRGFGVEFDPAYVDVICARLQETTGQVPVLEASGERHDFLANEEGAPAGRPVAAVAVS